MDKLLVICGPTATGKTDLAHRLAVNFHGELISADSRQVYRYMDVVTGKDIPEGFSYQLSDINIAGMQIGYYTNGKIKIWGYDLVYPNETFNIYLYTKFARKVINKLIKKGKLPILVGGTGLYIKSVTENLNNISIPPDEELRKKLADKDPKDLNEMIKKEGFGRDLIFNESDRNNAIRLIRRLEIIRHKKKEKNSTFFGDSGLDLPKKIDWTRTLWVGLTIRNREKLYEAIDKRVTARVGKEMDEEIELLKRKSFLSKIPTRTIGYKQWMKYLDGKITKENAIKLWNYAEHAYARRQIVWFKKNPQIKWFDVTDADYKESVDNLVKKWHNGRE